MRQTADPFLPGEFSQPAAATKFGKPAEQIRDLNKMRLDADGLTGGFNRRFRFRRRDELDFKAFRSLFGPTPTEPMFPAPLGIAGVSDHQQARLHWPLGSFQDFFRGGFSVEHGIFHPAVAPSTPTAAR